MSHAWRGRVGMIGLIVAEGSLFSVFVVAYLFYIGKSLNGPYPKRRARAARARHHLSACSSSVYDRVRARARSRERRRAALRALVRRDHRARRDVPRRHGAGVVRPDRRAAPDDRHQSLRDDLLSAGRACTPRHVIVGLVMLTVSAACFAWSGALRPRAAERVEIVSWYWHFVDAVWIVVFTVVYVIGDDDAGTRPTTGRARGARAPPRGRWSWRSASRWPSPASSPTSRERGRHRPGAGRGGGLVATGPARRSSVEHVPLRPLAERARPIVPSTSRGGAAQARRGRPPHAAPVQVQPLSAGVMGGLVGGVAMAVVALAYGAHRPAAASGIR